MNGKGASIASLFSTRDVCLRRRFDSVGLLDFRVFRGNFCKIRRKREAQWARVKGERERESELERGSRERERAGPMGEGAVLWRKQEWRTIHSSTLLPLPRMSSSNALALQLCKRRPCNSAKSAPRTGKTRLLRVSRVAVACYAEKVEKCASHEATREWTGCSLKNTVTRANSKVATINNTGSRVKLNSLHSYLKSKDKRQGCSVSRLTLTVTGREGLLLTRNS